MLCQLRGYSSRLSAGKPSERGQTSPVREDPSRERPRERPEEERRPGVDPGERGSGSRTKTGKIAANGQMM
jgi:hypothetical protein